MSEGCGQHGKLVMATWLDGVTLCDHVIHYLTSAKFLFHGASCDNDLRIPSVN